MTKEILICSICVILGIIMGLIFGVLMTVLPVHFM